jgi:hypothetical protein
MERESTGAKYVPANSEGSQSPPLAVELRKKNDDVAIEIMLCSVTWLQRV